MKKLLSVLLIMVLALSLVACGKKEEGGSDQKTMKLAIVYTALGDFWDICGSGGKKRVEELKTEYPDWNIELECTASSESGVAAQIQVLENLISLGYQGMCVAASDAEGMTPTLNQAVDAGIFVITMDTDCPDSKRACFVGTHNENFGRKLAQFAVEWEKDNGGAKIIVMHGAVAQLGMIQRLKGILFKLSPNLAPTRRHQRIVFHCLRIDNSVFVSPLFLFCYLEELQIVFADKVNINIVVPRNHSLMSNRADCCASSAKVSDSIFPAQIIKILKNLQFHFLKFLECFLIIFSIKHVFPFLKRKNQILPRRNSVLIINSSAALSL